MTMVRYPLPITAAMLLPANPNVTKPRYDTPADWSMGVIGNDVDVSSRSVPVVGPDSSATFTPYPIRTQTAKAAAMVPPGTVLADIGIDYGTYAGQTGRTGTITPKAPYPDQTSPPVVTQVSPSTGLAAGGTAVTISGWNLTGATGVTFGGTAATAVVVVSPNTITATSPAHAAGTVDVQVTTPKGVSPIAGSVDNFIYA
jgi:hypothetical protein